MVTKSRSGAPQMTINRQRILPFLVILFVASGCSALVYEIVWFQLLRLVIGSSAVSLGVLLGTFMGGMCLGSVLFPRLVDAKRHPLAVYAIIELLIGVFGLVLLLVIPLIGSLYVSFVGHGLAGILMRGLVAVFCLLPPTMLMGATLPAVARWVESTPEGVSWLGFFYGGNIAGAVAGCLLAGFYLLRIHDVAIATYVAVTINIAVFVVGFAMAKAFPFNQEENRSERATTGTATSSSNASQPSASQSDESGEEPVTSRPIVTPYVTIAFSGMCSLGAEVIWTRQLSLLLGASVYTFSIILAVFLTGLGVGSTAGSVLARRLKEPRLALGGCQLLACAALAWAAYSLCSSLPYWPIDPSLSSSPWIAFQLDIVRCAWAMLPAAVFWGASFPLALSVAASGDEDTGKLVGGVYAANTVGAIVGAVVFSMIIVGWVGTQIAQQVLVVCSSMSAIIIIAPLLSPRAPSRHQIMTGALAVLALIVTIPLANAVPQTPAGMIGYGRYLATWNIEDDEAMPNYIYVGEGMNASIAVSERTDGGYRDFHVSGKVVASSDPNDMRLQRMLAHLPAILHDDPRSALIVGCGAGVTSGTFLTYPDFERIVICEIEPLIPPAAGEHFAAENYGVIDHEMTQIYFDDARHFMATTDQKFDIITSDPIHPWVKGAAALYSREYYELCKKRLNEGGFITQWVPLYESNEEAVKSEIATFLEVFPNGTIWGNDIGGEGYDIVMLAQNGETTIDFTALKQKLSRPEYTLVFESLREVQLNSAMRIVAKYAGNAESLAEWLEDAEINRDRNMRLQYLAGMGLNQYDEAEIYDEILEHREYPSKMIIASQVDEVILRRLIGNSNSVSLPDF